MGKFFSQENPDLFKWLTGQADAPDNVVANPAFKVGQKRLKECWTRM